MQTLVTNMSKFQYQEISCSLPSGVADMMKKLNKLGADGWDLVSVCPTSSSQYGVEELTVFLKKEITK